MSLVTPLSAFAARRPLADFLRERGLVAPASGPAAAARWKPGLHGGALHGEVFAASREGAGAALALALALDRIESGALDDGRRWLWVQEREAMRRSGRPCLAGLPPALRHGLVHVAAQSAEDALFALEEGLRCRDLAFVIGEVAGNPRALSFTASRRLSLAAERHGVPLWLVRLDARQDLSSARMRWQARSACSQPPLWNAHAPGPPAWHAHLFRARAHPPGEWVLEGAANGLAARQQQADALDGAAFRTARSA